jgi:hypothetical protein
MSSFIIVSAYTTGTLYENEVKNLEKDCKKLSIPFYAHAYESTGSWVENTMKKPSILLECMDKLQDKYPTMVWVDADARINEYPSLFEEFDITGVDFSVLQIGGISRVLSGTVFMRLNQKIKILLYEWEKQCLTSSERLGDQKALRDIITNQFYSFLGIFFKSLPYSYCYIFDDTVRKISSSVPPLSGEPIIVHTQASRRAKHVYTKS